MHFNLGWKAGVWLQPQWDTGKSPRLMTAICFRRKFQQQQKDSFLGLDPSLKGKEKAAELLGLVWGLGLFHLLVKWVPSHRL